MSVSETFPADPPRGIRLRSWRTIVGLAAVAGGAAMITGAFLPWAEAFAGLIGIPGTRGTNGQILLAAGAIIAVAGLYHVVRGGSRGRWLIGLAGFASLAFSGWLLLRLTTTLQALGSSMDLVKGGPGLWVIAAGALLPFGTLFLPASQQQAFVQRPEDGAGFLAWGAVSRQARCAGCSWASGLPGCSTPRCSSSRTCSAGVPSPASSSRPAWAVPALSPPR